MRRVIIVIAAFVILRPITGWAGQTAEAVDDDPQAELAMANLPPTEVSSEAVKQDKADHTFTAITLPFEDQGSSSDDFAFYISPHDLVNVKPYSQKGSTGVLLKIKW